MEKSDENLYRELKRLMPTTCLGTYVRANKWRRDLLEVDLELIKVGSFPGLCCVV